MINEDDVEKLASAAGVLAPSTSVYLEEDFVMNLLETVLDYMLRTEVVVKALEHFRENRWNEVAQQEAGAERRIISARLTRIGFAC